MPVGSHSSHGAGRRIVIRMLGPVEVLVDGAPLVVDTRKAIALLAYLAATGRPVPRDRLAALLWPEADGSRANGALRRTLSVLRAGVGGLGLVITRAAVGLRGDQVDVDLARLPAALDRSRAHAHPDDVGCSTCREALAEAARLVRGPFMDGFSLRDSDAFDEWQEAETEHVRGQVTAVLERLARTSLAAGDVTTAIEAGGRWIELDPLHEPAHCVLMRAHAAAGEQGAAIAQYRACVRVLDLELGVAPLAETTELYEAIRQGHATVATGSEPLLEAGGPGEGAEGRSLRPSVRGAPPLVGRDGELVDLLASWSGATPDGRLIVIDGEAGIGKTRILDALAEAVSMQGGHIARVACHAGEQSLAFAAVATLVRSQGVDPATLDRLQRLPAASRAEVARLVPELGAIDRGVRPSSPATGDPAARARLLEATSDAIEALLRGPRPGLVAVEDLQWADGSSVELVAYLARRLAGRPLALVISWRREELEGPAARFAVEVDRMADRYVRLERLSPAATIALAGSLARDRARDRAELERVALGSEGLPLFVVAALAAEAMPSRTLPAGVVALQRERLAAVSETSAQVLTAAAVLGRSFDFATLREVSGRSDDEVVASLEELARRGIVRELPADPGVDVRFDFTHASLRDVAYEDASLARRRLLHRRAADALRAARPSRSAAVDWSLIARHEQAGGREAEAAAAFVLAGDAARDLLAHTEAVGAYRDALALGAPDAAALHERIGEIDAAIGDYSAAIASLEAAAAALDGPAAVERASSIEHHLGRIHLFRGDLVAAESHLAAAIAALGDGSSRTRARLLAERASVALRAGDLDLAAETASAGLAMASETADDRAASQALRVLGLSDRGRGRIDAARDHLAQSLAAAAGDLPATVAARNALALVEADGGRVDVAIAHAEAALESARRAGYRHIEAAIENNLADILHAAGREDESREHQRRAVALFADVARGPGELEPEIWKLVEW